jgi:hypothetical protein
MLSPVSGLYADQVFPILPVQKRKLKMPTFAPTSGYDIFYNPSKSNPRVSSFAG